MATTRIMPIHLGKSRSAGKAIATTIEYVSNPEKTDNGRLITTWECDTRLASSEFLFTHQQYMKHTGRTQKAEDVVAYHLRQAFLPGEVTPEKANALGCELAGRLTKGNHAYIVCTHIDKAHIHNHIIWNAVDLTAIRKFRNFWNSTKAVRQLSDTICIENGCSVIAEPKRKGKSYNKWLEENSKSGNLLVDIQAKLKEGKGAGYEHWAKLFNLKQMAKTIACLQEYCYNLFPKLKERRKQLAGTMSGGEQQMCAIARAMMSCPKVLMLDEPSLGLAPVIVDDILKAIVDINKAGTTILLVEQNVMASLEIANRAYVIEQGMNVMEGDANVLMDNDDLRKAYLGI